MMTQNFYFQRWITNGFIILSLMFLMFVPVRAQNANRTVNITDQTNLAAIRTLINDAIVAVNNLGGGTVTVTGVHVCTAPISEPVNIPSGVTVLWKADLSSDVPANYVLCLSGEGVFEVTDEGIETGTSVRIANFALSAMYVQRAIFVEAGSTVTVKVSGGTVSTLHKGIAISSGANVEVSGGTVSAGGNTSSAISGRTNITISGTGRVEAQATAINTSGTITVNGGTIIGSFAVQNSLTVAQNVTLTIPQEYTLAVREKATVNNYGTIVNNGTIANSGIIVNNGTITNNKVINIDNGKIVGGNVLAGEHNIYLNINYSF